jgi:hypothetical protein
MNETRARKHRRGAVPARLGLQLWDLAVLLACLVAFWHGWRATRDLAWPPDFDLYRDISIAQTMLDGGGMADPAYPGERLWYNPLVPGVVAGISWLSGWPAPVVYARVGPYLNLLAPLCFYLMVAYLFKDRLIALTSTLAFLFVTCQYPASRACATYSPWLFTANFTQAGFFLTLALYERGLRDGRRRGFLLVGLMLGLTFLGHTAPALILGSWVFSELETGNISALIRANLSLPNLIALAGGIILWARPRDRSTYLLTLWLVTCPGFIGLNYLSQLASRLELTSLHTVPSIHFLFYLTGSTPMPRGRRLRSITHFLLLSGASARLCRMLLYWTCLPANTTCLLACGCGKMAAACGERITASRGSLWARLTSSKGQEDPNGR